jgi:hypothetical protein
MTPEAHPFKPARVEVGTRFRYLQATISSRSSRNLCQRNIQRHPLYHALALEASNDGSKSNRFWGTVLAALALMPKKV